MTDIQKKKKNEPPSFLAGPTEKVPYRVPGRSCLKGAGLTWSHPHALTWCLSFQHQSPAAATLYISGSGAARGCEVRSWHGKASWEASSDNVSHADPEGEGGSMGLLLESQRGGFPSVEHPRSRLPIRIWNEFNLAFCDCLFDSWRWHAVRKEIDILSFLFQQSKL